MDKSRIKVIMEQYDSIVQKEEEINIEIRLPQSHWL